jgi:hypothetical protein
MPLNHEMYCLLQWFGSLDFISKTQARKGFILYNTTNGKITLKTHMSINHSIIAKMFEKKVNSPLKGEVKKLLAKKIPSLFGNSISNFLL